MRRILVDAARRRLREKHGGGQAVLPLQDADIPLQQPAKEILAVSEALDQIALSRRVRLD